MRTCRDFPHFLLLGAQLQAFHHLEAEVFQHCQLLEVNQACHLLVVVQHCPVFHHLAVVQLFPAFPLSEQPQDLACLVFRLSVAALLSLVSPP